MDKDNNVPNNNVNNDKFTFVSVDEKIFDKKFEGKPRGFLADAMVRFVRNKVNVVAFFIVILLVMLSILVPIISTKDFTSPTVRRAQNLPPRIPLLEKLGIADGSQVVNEYPADPNNIDPTTGLMLPKNSGIYFPEYIKSGTLTNGFNVGNMKRPEYLGGTNRMTLEDYFSYTIRYIAQTDSSTSDTSSGEEGYTEPNLVSLVSGQMVSIEMQSISENSALVLRFIELDIDGAIVMTHDLLTITSEDSISGEDSFTVTSEIPITASGYLELHYENTSGELEHMVASIFNVKISQIVLENGEEVENVVFFSEGYDLSKWESQTIDDQGGSWLRADAVYYHCSFVYFPYNRLAADVLNRDYSGTDLEKNMVEYPLMAEQFGSIWNEIKNTPVSSGGKVVFDFGGVPFEFQTTDETRVPIRRIHSITKNSDKTPSGTIAISYTMKVDFDGVIYSGFASMPYFLFGTDAYGHDMFGMIWLSLRTSLLLGLIVTIINVVVGIIYGAIEGYYGGKVDFVMERIAEYISYFPGLTILTILYLTYGPGLGLLLIYLVYAGWIGTASLTRVQFYRYRGREYVLASRTLGASDMRLIFKHILPNGIGIIITSSILSIPAMIFTESSLSFLGFGIGHGVTLDFGLFKMPGLSLGVILYDGFRTMLVPGLFYQMLIPAIIITILMISFNMFGNALRDAVNPTLRGTE